MKKTAWQLFSETGNIGHYLLYKAVDNEDGHNNTSSDAQNNRHQ